MKLRNYEQITLTYYIIILFGISSFQLNPLRMMWIRDMTPSSLVAHGYSTCARRNHQKCAQFFFELPKLCY